MTGDLATMVENEIYENVKFDKTIEWTGFRRCKFINCNLSEWPAYGCQFFNVTIKCGEVDLEPPNFICCYNKAISLYDFLKFVL